MQRASANNGRSRIFSATAVEFVIAWRVFYVSVAMEMYGCTPEPQTSASSWITELCNELQKLKQSKQRLLVQMNHANLDDTVRNVNTIWHMAASPPHMDGSVVFAWWRQCAPIYSKPQNGCHDNVPRMCILGVRWYTCPFRGSNPKKN